MLDQNIVQKIKNKFLNGESLTRKESIFFRNEKDTRKGDLVYVLSHEEKEEYFKCYSDFKYFINKYYPEYLKEYSMEIIDNIINNRFTINLISREMNVTKLIGIFYLHKAMFSHDKTISIITSKGDEQVEVIDIIWKLYKKLPFFLQTGVCTKTLKHISFDNKSRIITESSKYAGISRISDVLCFINLKDYKKYKEVLKGLIPIQLSLKYSTINIFTSADNKNSFLYSLIENSYLKNNHPKKNFFKTIKTYWWEYKGRDEEWKNNKIKEVGEKCFKNNYDIEFI